jgi:glutamyl-tRNA synthetase
MSFFKKNNSVRTRIAPSPTGTPHIGNIRTALFDYLYAKSNKGTFIVRIEDTDQKRSVDFAVEHFLEALSWLGIVWDEGPDLRGTIIVGEKGAHGSYWQSRRLDTYTKYAEQLLSQNDAYYCFCTPTILDEMRKEQITKKQITKYDGRCRILTNEEISTKKAGREQTVIRLKIPQDSDITFTDVLRGTITINSSEIEDQVLIKSDGYPTYHLASVVDDHDMKISHVLRGEEWIASTPKHVYLYERFGWTAPHFVHLSLVLGPNKQKLSKRDGSFSVEDLKQAGYLPEAIVNYLVFLGWRKKSDDRELYTLHELESIFSLEDVNKTPAIFDRKKLDWFNAQYIRKLSIPELEESIEPYLDMSRLKKVDSTFLTRLLTVEQVRYEKLSDVQESTSIYLEDITYEVELLYWKDIQKNRLQENLQKVKAIVSHIKGTHWSLSEIENTLKEFIARESLTNGEVLWPLRVALTGRKQSPGPFESAYILGKVRTLDRIDTALDKLV